METPAKETNSETANETISILPPTEGEMKFISGFTCPKCKHKFPTATSPQDYPIQCPECHWEQVRD